MLSLGINGCRCVVLAPVSIDLNVGRLEGDAVVLEMWRANLLSWSARKTSGRQQPEVAVQVYSRAAPVQTRCNAFVPLPQDLAPAWFWWSRPPSC